jgi:hypothetical protein
MSPPLDEEFFLERGCQRAIFPVVSQAIPVSLRVSHTYGTILPRTAKKYVSVYLTEEQLQVLQKAAEEQHRSLSNYLLALGLERAAELQGKPSVRKNTAEA